MQIIEDSALEMDCDQLNSNDDSATGKIKHKKGLAWEFFLEFGKYSLNIFRKCRCPSHQV